MVYICDKCKKSFDHKGHYINHIQRKKSCNIIKKNSYNNKNISIDSDLSEDSTLTSTSTSPLSLIESNNDNLNCNLHHNFKCLHCDKSFSRKYTLERHINKSCKQKSSNLIVVTNSNPNLNITKTNSDLNITKTNPNTTNSDLNITNKNCNKIKTIEEQMNKLIVENKELKNDITELKKVKKVTNHYSNNIMNIGSINTINTINNNFIMKFGREDIYKLNDEDRYKILFEKGIDPILESIERTHFNNRLPDQQNIHLTNINSRYVNLHNGKTWEKTKLDSTTDTLIENHAYNLSLMVDECDENKKPKIKKSVNKSIQMVNDYFKLENDDLKYSDEKSRKEKETTIRNEITELKENVKLKLYNKTQEIQGQQKDKYLVV